MVAAEDDLEVSSIKGRLDSLNSSWEELLDKSLNKRHELEGSLKEVNKWHYFGIGLFGYSYWACLSF